jgi:hypothetical protein
MNKQDTCPQCGQKYGVKFDGLVNTRPPVTLFAREMEDVLRANDFKGGWGKDECTLDFLRMKLIENLGEYAQAERESDHYRAQKCLVDVSNYAMMLWDRSKYH